jgi:hypothetical protein
MLANLLERSPNTNAFPDPLPASDLFSAQHQPIWDSSHVLLMMVLPLNFMGNDVLPAKTDFAALLVSSD